jgi:hypothetical protein
MLFYISNLVSQEEEEEEEEKLFLDLFIVLKV